MPSLIEGESRQAVKRAVPKPANKIHAGAVARLYVAYPDKHRWTYTGLQGAVVLANDLVGHTFWLKMVDISPAARGVIWDQEVYDTFSYNQDRVFFHTFELEDCLAGLSFADDKEAKTFKKKMDEREKNAHRNTRAKVFGNTAGHPDEASSDGKHHSRLGDLGRSLIPGHRHSSASNHSPSQSVNLSRDPSLTSSPPGSATKQKENILDNIDQALLNELLELGLTKDQLVENADFIQTYINQKQSSADVGDRRGKAPAPTLPLTPQDTGSTSSSRRGPPPAPPPARKTTQDGARPPSPPAEAESQAFRGPAPGPARGPPPTPFRVPPPFAGAGKYANDPDSPTSPNRRRAGSTTQQPAAQAPAPPPRPPKTPLEEEQENAGHKFGVPPPFTQERKPVGSQPRNATAPPPPPARNTRPPAPRSRDASGSAGNTYSVPPANAIPPSLPPKIPNASPPSSTSTDRPIPPPLPPSRDNRPVPPPPSASASNQANDAPPPPPPPPPPMPSAANPPPPPPLPSQGQPAPPAPPPPPGMTPATANAPKTSGGGRDNLMADIRGGARLKKVDDNEKRDRSAAAVGAGGDTGGAATTGSQPAAGGGGAEAGGLAGALASALAARKSKVSQSDDEDDKDDW